MIVVNASIERLWLAGPPTGSGAPSLRDAGLIRPLPVQLHDASRGVRREVEATIGERVWTVTMQLSMLRRALGDEASMGDGDRMIVHDPSTRARHSLIVRGVREAKTATRYRQVVLVMTCTASPGDEPVREAEGRRHAW